MKTIKVLIVEDEPLAAAQLAALIAGIKPEAQIQAVCDTVESTINWIEQNDAPDLAFFDIHLGDGLCFDIFKKTNFSSPIIFTTAYNKYTLQAFKVNSIDYLLKPIDKDELKQALSKFDKTSLHSSQPITGEQMQNIIQSILKKEYKQRFLVKIGTHLKAIQANQIAYIYSFQKGTYMKLYDNKNYLLDQSLETIEELVDPQNFFRINRKYLIALDAVTDVSIYSNSRLKLKVKCSDDDDFYVAREKVKSFKNWLEGTNT